MPWTWDGFIWKAREQHYLVTNWHVLSMRDFFTGENLRKDVGRLNVLRALFNSQTGDFAKQRWDIPMRQRGWCAKESALTLRC